MILIYFYVAHIYNHIPCLVLLVLRLLPGADNFLAHLKLNGCVVVCIFLLRFFFTNFLLHSHSISLYQTVVFFSINTLL